MINRTNPIVLSLQFIVPKTEITLYGKETSLEMGTLLQYATQSL